MAHDVVHVIGDAEHNCEDHHAAVIAADEQRAIVGPDPDARGDGVHEQARLPVAVGRAEHEEFASVRRQGCHVAAVDDQLDRVGTDDVTEVEDGDEPPRDYLVQSVGAVQSEGPLPREGDPFHGRVRAREPVESLQHAVLAHVVDQSTALDGRPVHRSVNAVREVAHAAAVDDDDAVVAEGAGVDQDVVLIGAAPQFVQRDGVRAAPLAAQAVHTQAYFVLSFTTSRLLQRVATEPLLLEEHQVAASRREERLADDVAVRHLQPLCVATVDVHAQVSVRIGRPIVDVAIVTLEEYDLDITWS